MRDEGFELDGLGLEEGQAICRLLGEVAMLEAPRNERRVALLKGLCKLIDADAWLWFAATPLVLGAPQAYSVFLKEGFTDEQLAKFSKTSVNPDMAKLTGPLFQSLEENGALVTLLRQQMDPDGDLLGSDAYPLWRGVGFESFLWSARKASDHQISVIGFYRKSDHDWFREHESEIVHTTLSAVPALHEGVISEGSSDLVTGLSNRLRQVLQYLLLGYSRKQMASSLNLSIHTLNGYVSEIYRHFGVHSQVELMRLFTVGDGGEISVA